MILFSTGIRFHNLKNIMNFYDKYQTYTDVRLNLIHMYTHNIKDEFSVVDDISSLCFITYFVLIVVVTHFVKYSMKMISKDHVPRIYFFVLNFLTFVATIITTNERRSRQ